MGNNEEERDVVGQSDSAPERGVQAIAVVIPSYKVTRHILGVIAGIGPEVDTIYCVDDACPEQSGRFIEQNNTDPRVRVLYNQVNQGVGGATMAGYRQAAADGMAVIVKIDGDGQMDPTLLPSFVAPILNGEADYTKGNRFWDLSQISQMPLLRRFGNLGLSFLAKASSGYWRLFDPTNGYTAIHAAVAQRLPMEAISTRYFFETDLLFRLNAMQAVVQDVPMDARYGDEVSNLKISQVLGEFALKHARNFCKRIAYRYYLRDLTIASLELVAAFVLLGGGALYGGWNWIVAAGTGVSAPVGTVVLPAIAIVSGLQFMLAFLSYDIANQPVTPVHRSLMGLRR
ncbi:glycosyltransferase family 2 protein [Stenotrophomonas sp. YAU14D1_LEIMI4_1]|uniref:glycosyltransferase family 2 protein n=1 Tax=Stenotrophomonas TaxID=40323 RepID=UPI000D53ED6B|nr:glycosyltransferase family 2 protein [Stenotrophomonas sp. YAU14D1_LEIMI4_1]AWH24128.1 glycosyl transferase family 2 [Stenotrophomonas sp. YAU14D1_LEIMI4_1]